jgi:hypothetical protein
MVVVNRARGFLVFLAPGLFSLAFLPSPCHPYSMKKLCKVLFFGSAIVCGIIASECGCSTTTTTAGPTGTNVVTTVKGIDAATLAEIDAALAQAASNAPAIASSIIAVQNAIHGAPAVVVTNK